MKKYWQLTLKFHKGFIKTILVILIILLPFYLWLIAWPIYLAKHEFDDRRSVAIDFIIRATLGITESEHWPKPVLEKMHKIKIPEDKLNSLACLDIMSKEAWEQCKYIYGKPTNPTYKKKINGKLIQFECQLTDKITLKECLRTDSTTWKGDDKIAIYSRKDMLDKYPDILQEMVRILQEPCDYLPSNEEVAKMINDSNPKRTINYDSIIDFRKELKCDDFKAKESRETILLHLVNYVRGNGGNLTIETKRRD